MVSSQCLGGFLSNWLSSVAPNVITCNAAIASFEEAGPGHFWGEYLPREIHGSCMLKNTYVTINWYNLYTYIYIYKYLFIFIDIVIYIFISIYLYSNVLCCFTYTYAFVFQYTHYTVHVYIYICQCLKDVLMCPWCLADVFPWMASPVGFLATATKVVWRIYRYALWEACSNLTPQGSLTMKNWCHAMKFDGINIGV